MSIQSVVRPRLLQTSRRVSGLTAGAFDVTLQPLWQLFAEHFSAPGADPATRGRDLRHHPSLGSEGANVNFVMADSDQCRVRTYERGVEGETLACGTGVVATALVLAYTDLRRLPCEITTRAGCVLVVAGSLTPDGGLEDPKLTGQGRLVFSGVLRSE